MVPPGLEELILDAEEVTSLADNEMDDTVDGLVIPRKLAGHTRFKGSFASHLEAIQLRVVRTILLDHVLLDQDKTISRLPKTAGLHVSDKGDQVEPNDQRNY